MDTLCGIQSQLHRCQFAQWLRVITHKTPCWTKSMSLIGEKQTSRRQTASSFWGGFLVHSDDNWLDWIIWPCIVTIWTSLKTFLGVKVDGAQPLYVQLLRHSFLIQFWKLVGFHLLTSTVWAHFSFLCFSLFMGKCIIQNLPKNGAPSDGFSSHRRQFIVLYLNYH